MADRTLINFHPKSKPTYVFYSYGGVFVFLWMPLVISDTLCKHMLVVAWLMHHPSGRYERQLGSFCQDGKKTVVETTTQELFSIPDGV